MAIGRALRGTYRGDGCPLAQVVYDNRLVSPRLLPKANAGFRGDITTGPLRLPDRLVRGGEILAGYPARLPIGRAHVFPRIAIRLHGRLAGRCHEGPLP